MPGNNSNAVMLGRPLVTGGVLLGPLGTALPTDATTTLNAAFLSGGYVGEDGVTENVDRSTDKIKAWGGDTIAVPQTDFEVTYEWSFAQTHDTNVLKAVYGAANVTATAATSSAGLKHAVQLNATQLPKQSIVIEIRDGAAKIRIVIPNGQLTQSGEVSYTNDDIVAYPVTVDCLPDASGNVAYKYMDDGRPTA